MKRKDMLRSYLIPPSSHFLDSLSRLYFRDLEEKKYNTLEVAFVFPTRRACLYFTRRLIQNKSSESFFLPKIFSWEEFINFCGERLIDVSYKLLTNAGFELLLLRTLKELGLNFKEPEEDVYWTKHYLQVFEELEKEGLTPKDLKIPPEGLPNKAQEFLENLTKVYEHFKSRSASLNYLSQAQLLQKIAEKLQETDSYKKLKTSSFYFCGFAALRKSESNLLKAFVELAKMDNLDTTIVFAWDAEKAEPHPILQRTFKDLGLTAERLILDASIESSKKLPSVIISETSDVHEEVELVCSNLKKDVDGLSAESLPEKIALIVPREETLLPLIYALEEVVEAGEHSPLQEINIAQSFPLYHHPLNLLLLNIIRLQKERVDDKYPVAKYFELLTQPLLKLLFPFLPQLLEALSKILQNKYDRVSLHKVEALIGVSEGSFLQAELSKIHDLFFRNWENVDEPTKLAQAIEEFLKLLLPLFSKDDAELIAYLTYLQTEVLPLFLQDELWEGLKDRRYPLYQLRKLLERTKYYLSGEPLKGLQILGFLETRLLNFEKAYLLDLNEGVLPPREDFNPLLTDEMRSYFGLPVFTSSLWDYYFLTFLESVDELFITYIGVEGEDSANEPSRFIYRLRYEFAKSGQSLSKKTPLRSFPKRNFQEGIPVTDEHRELILSYLKNAKLSRSFFETYLRCPAKFYFRYLLKIKEEESEAAFLGNITHKILEALLKPWIKTNDFIDFKEVVQKVDEKVDNVWELMRFGEKFDPLSDLMVRMLIKGFFKKYFEALMEQRIKRRVLGIEDSVVADLTMGGYEGLSTVKLYGKCDLRMEEEASVSLNYLILDLKTSASAGLRPKVFQKFLNDKIDDFKPSQTFSEYQKKLEDWKSLFGSNLNNFQLTFYLWLEIEKRNLINSDYSLIKLTLIKPTLVKKNSKDKPEESLPVEKAEENLAEESLSIEKAELFKINKFSNLLRQMIFHMLTTPYFYFTEKDNDCDWCSYYSICLSYRLSSS
jgi:ATP-dependent helicase/nuclease subunit B